MDNRYDDAIQNAERDEAPLGIGKAVVLVGEGRTLEDSRRIDEVEPC